MIYDREETGHFQAKRKAARRYRGDEIRPRDLPSDREIRNQIPAVVDDAEAQKGDKSERRHGASQYLSAPLRQTDRFRAYELLLLPLENLKVDPRIDPAGDVLYHSLQVFELARNSLPYDEEFLLAALLHDVGKAIDPRDHVASGLEALDGYITPRTAWLIEHHIQGMSLLDGTLGVRSRRRLQSAESFDELMLLAECDRGGQAAGVAVADVQEALSYLRNLAQSCGE